MRIGSIENHRSREGGALVYPVYSRRSQGLSMGINLFPDHKRCSFDCPYCEVFPFKTNSRFSPELMEKQLLQELSQAAAQGLTVKDICFSGNGEPTISPYFSDALERASLIRDTWSPEADLVVITNGTGLLEGRLFDTLGHAAAGPMGLKIWLKLDAGTEDWYREMNRSQVPYRSLMNAIRDLAGSAPVTIQTMLCQVKGKPPSQAEASAWEKLVVELSRIRAAGEPVKKDATGNRIPGIRDIHLYGKARPAAEDPAAAALPLSYLETRALSLKKVLEDAGLNPAVQVFP
ncbi:MAG: radical SAM protein [Treponema sp.]|nr:radical SAM protein [Treponema sp.]